MAGAAKRYEKLGLRESLSRIYQYPIACEELSSIVRFAFSKSPKKLQSLVFQDILAAFSLLPEMQTRSAISAAHALLQSSEAALPKQKKVLAVKEFKQAMVAQKRRCKARKEDEGLAQLPLDVIDHIFSFLDWRSLVSASAVCRLWNTAASDNHLWKLQYVTLFNKSPINCDLGDGDYIRARGDIDTEHSIDWRSAFKRACKGICSKKFTYYRGYCGHCNSIVWLNETTFSEGLINASNCKNHKLKPVSTLQIMEVLSSLNFRRSAGAEATFVVVDGVSSMDSDDEDSFIDLVFASPKCKEKAEYISKRVNEEICSNKSFESDSEARFGFVDSPRDVFSGAKVYPVETNLKAPSPISVLKSPTRLKVFALGLRKSKSVKTASTASTGASALSLGDQFRKSLSDEESKRFPAKYVVGDAPAADSFTRNNTLRCKIQQERVKDASPFDLRKRLPKYLKLIKPLYMKVKTLSSKTAAPVKPGNIPAGHRVFCNHLGKSKSTSAASRRDDSLLQQHDGIQSAILHCKRSYNSASSDCSVLARSASDPSCEKSIDPP